jgi:hypothetical protein
VREIIRRWEREEGGENTKRVSGVESQDTC